MKILDLFSGIGGFSYGLHNTGGFETVAFCEIDKNCHKVLKKHWPHIPIFTNISDIYMTDDCLMSEIDPSTGYLDNKIEVIVGGFPCQDLSVGGKKRGLNGERSGLWFEYLRLINEIRPRWVIIENVARLVENGLDIVLQGLSEAGYDAEWSVIEATHVGLPHRRERIYIVANLRGLRQHECYIQDGSIQAYTQWEIAKTYHKGEKCESQSIPVCPIFSSRAFDSFRNSNPGRESALSELRRVTNGIPEGLDERRRKARIKQLGNSIVPQIVEIIGHEILIRESIIKERCKGL